MERSLLGEPVPVVRNGFCIGERHRFDNRLAMATLNAIDRRAARSRALDALLDRYFKWIESADNRGIEKPG
jgi:hypothetical protein